MKFGSILRGALQFGVALFQAIKGTKEKAGNKDLADILTGAITQLLPAIVTAQITEKLTTPEKIISWLKTIDATTGEEQTAIEMIPGLDPREEEIISDSLCDIAGTIMFSKISLNYADFIDQVRTN